MIKNVIDFQISSDPNLGALNKSADGSTFSIRMEEKGLGVPLKAKACTLEVIGSEFWYNTSNITEKNNQLRITSNGISKLLSITPGLYSIDTFQNALIQAIRATADNTFINSLILVSGSSTTCYLNFVANQALNRVDMIISPLSGNTITVDFRQSNAPNTISSILGFIGVYQSTSSVVITGENVPKFNALNYYLIQSNIVSNGIRINSKYENIIAKIKITCEPNQQNIYDPMNPTVVLSPELINDTRKQFTFSLLDSNLNFVDTKSELWSATLRLTYFT